MFSYMFNVHLFIYIYTHKYTSVRSLHTVKNTHGTRTKRTIRSRTNIQRVCRGRWGDLAVFFFKSLSDQTIKKCSGFLMFIHLMERYLKIRLIENVQTFIFFFQVDNTLVLCLNMAKNFWGKSEIITEIYPGLNLVTQMVEVRSGPLLV